MFSSEQPGPPNASSLAAFIAAMPKVELHVHLEGSIQPATLLALARRNQITLPADDAAGLRSLYQFTDFTQFVRTYLLISKTLQRADDFALITAEFGAQMARQNIRYAEVTFTPVTHVDRGVPWEAIRDGLCAGREQAQRTHGVQIAWVFDIVRCWPETAERCCDLAIAGQKDGVIGLGLGGPEAGHPPERFAEVFARARACGLHSVPHAGELAGPQSVEGALFSLSAERIGHGVRCVEDRTLVEKLRSQQIPLEICPSSNLCLGLYPDLEHHPFRTLWLQGLCVTVNSDDPALFNTDLNREYELVAQQCGFGREELQKLSLRALSASFLEPQKKAALKQTFLNEFAKLR